MKKIIVLLAASLCLGACGQQTTVSEDSSATLVWYLPGDKQTDMAEVMEAANKITQEEIGVKLDMQFIDTGAYTERMNMNLASNAEFDLCFTGFVNPYYNAAKRGGYLGLSQYLEKMPALKNALPDYAWESSTIDGEIYAVPNLQIMASGRAIIVQKEYALKYGLDMNSITKTEDIEPFLEQIKQNEPSLYPFDSGWGVWSFDNFPNGVSIISFLVGLEQADGSYKVQPMLHHETYQKNIKLLRSWFEKGYIRKDVASVMDDSQDKKLGKYVVSINTYKPGMDAENFAVTGIETVSAPIEKAVLGRGDATMIAVSRTTKYPEEAVKLIELVNTNKELYNLLSFGIEDKHYTKTAPNRIELIGGENAYRPNAAWKFGNQFNAYLLPGQDDDVWEKTIELNDSARKTALLGFRPDTDPIKSEVSQVETVLKTYKVMDNGSDDPANYMDTFLKKLDEAGMPTICEVMQQQVDDFISK